MVEVNIKVKKLKESAIIPTSGSEQAAGMDLYACIEEDIIIKPHESIKISTGLAFEIPEGTMGCIYARSGLASKEGLRPANCVGVCDSDYRGEYCVVLHNDTTNERTISSGERIAQMILIPYIKMNFTEVTELSDTQRGTGGFGSTGK